MTPPHSKCDEFHSMAIRTHITRPFSRISRSTSRRTFTDAASHPSNRVQVYRSNSQDPHLNLSIEHFLLQNSHPASIILFLYTNRPCVVIGRNQNPWLEVNLGLLRQGLPPTAPRAPLPRTRTSHDTSTDGSNDDGGGEILLVRRRSGGGTVFHDAGNVNYSVICPSAAFDRNRHAEMVARALQGLGAASARVNCRHDIVMDGDADGDVGSGTQSSAPATFKISGSAYKLTRLRALHHGTCLLSSPHLDLISPLLRSPLRPYLRARGVESVRSPVRNVGGGVRPAEFTRAVIAEFRTMYGARGGFDVEAAVGEADALADVRIRSGYEELKSRDWIYGQTPQFVFDTYPVGVGDQPKQRSPLSEGLPPQVSELFQQKKKKGRVKNSR